MGLPRVSPLIAGAASPSSHICLRAEFVLKRFIIFLTGRFPASVLVNNCSQLNLHKICIAGTGGTQHARISCKPTSGSFHHKGAARWHWGHDVAPLPAMGTSQGQGG